MITAADGRVSRAIRVLAKGSGPARRMATGLTCGFPATSPERSRVMENISRRNVIGVAAGAIAGRGSWPATWPRGGIGSPR